MNMMLLKSLAKQEARHSEPLAGEESVSFSPAHRAIHMLAPDSRLPTSFKNDKTNPN